MKKEELREIRRAVRAGEMACPDDVFILAERAVEAATMLRDSVFFGDALKKDDALRAAESRAARAEEALWMYARHQGHCDVSANYAYPPDAHAEGSCTCGLTAALENGEST